MGRIILFLLISFVGFSQASQITIQGEDYQFVGDYMMDYRMPRPTTYQANIQTRYSDIQNWDDPNEILHAFIRDGILRGANFDFGDSTSFMSIVGDDHWNCVDCRYPGRSSENLPGGSSYNSHLPGYRIALRQSYWDTFTEERGSYYYGRLNLVYHELGHALIHLDHSCNNYGIMYSPRGCTDGRSHYHEGTWENSLNIMFGATNYIRRSTRSTSSKGSHTHVIDN